MRQTTKHDDRLLRGGLMYGIAAYATWGLVPMYYKQLTHVPPLGVLGHRTFWTAIVLAALICIQRRWPQVLACARNGRAMAALVGTSCAIAVNWFTFIWGVTHEYVLECSLGYFISPLVNVLLGMLFLRERLRRGQVIGLVMATVGVLNMAWQGERFPWLGLILASSFGLYALLRKTAPAGPMVGSMIETAMLAPIGAIVALRYTLGGPATGPSFDVQTYAWLGGTGVLTALPMVWFAVAARRLRLSTIGFLQYLSPSGQFALAVFVYGEPFYSYHLVSFGLIWTALMIYSLDSWRAYQQAKQRGLEVVTAASIQAVPLD